MTFRCIAIEARRVEIRELAEEVESHGQGAVQENERLENENERLSLELERARAREAALQGVIKSMAR